MGFAAPRNIPHSKKKHSPKGFNGRRGGEGHTTLLFPALKGRVRRWGEEANWWRGKEREGKSLLPPNRKRGGKGLGGQEKEKKKEKDVRNVHETSRLEKKNISLSNKKTRH